MARIGLRNFRYGILDEETETYAEVKTPGKAVDCKVSLDLNSAELYADDALAESDYTFKKGTVNITVDEDDDQTYSDLTGHEISEAGEIVRKDTDKAPYVGFGRIITKVVNGVYKYKVEFLPKVKFSEPAQEESTKGDSIEFKTPTIEGVVTKLSDGTWSKAKTFTNKEDAIAYLDELLSSK